MRLISYKYEAKYWLGKHDSWADPAKLIGVGHWVSHWRGAEGHPTFPTFLIFCRNACINIFCSQWLSGVCTVSVTVLCRSVMYIILPE